MRSSRSARRPRRRRRCSPRWPGAGAAAGAFPRVVGRDRIGRRTGDNRGAARRDSGACGPGRLAGAGPVADARGRDLAQDLERRDDRLAARSSRPTPIAISSHRRAAPGLDRRRDGFLGPAAGPRRRVRVATEVPLVAAHNDLTAANMLLGRRSGSASSTGRRSTPRGPARSPTSPTRLADIAAAVDGYRSREAAFAACFERDGELAEMTPRARSRGAAMLDIEPVYAELLRPCDAGCATRPTNGRRARAGAELRFSRSCAGSPQAPHRAGSRGTGVMSPGDPRRLSAACAAGCPAPTGPAPARWARPPR